MRSVTIADPMLLVVSALASITALAMLYSNTPQKSRPKLVIGLLCVAVKGACELAVWIEAS